MFLFLYRPIYLLFEYKPGVSTSPSASEDDYDYLFYREILLNSGESTSETMTGKNPPRF